MIRRGPGRYVLLAVLALLAVGGCDDDEPAPSEEPIVHGPFTKPPSLDADAHERLAEPESKLGEEAEAHFFWWNPKAAGKTVRFEVVAESAPPLELGAVVHVEERQVADGTEQGRIEVHPREFNRGGARRDSERTSKWVEGVYRIEAQLGDEPFAETVFEVHP